MKNIITTTLLFFSLFAPLIAQDVFGPLTHARLIVEEASKQFPEDKVIKAINDRDVEGLSKTFIDPHHLFQINVSPERIKATCPEAAKVLEKMPADNVYNGSVYAFGYLGLATLMAHEAFGLDEDEKNTRKKQTDSCAVTQHLLDQGCTPNTTCFVAHFVNGLDYIYFTPLMFLAVDHPEYLGLLLDAEGRVDVIDEQKVTLLQAATIPESKQLLLEYQEKQKNLPKITYKYSDGGSSEGTPRNMWIDGKLKKQECSCKNGQKAVEDHVASQPCCHCISNNKD